MTTTQNSEFGRVLERLERLRQDGYFHEPRSVSAAWCRLKDFGEAADLVVLGLALRHMSEQQELLLTALCDGLLHYVDAADASDWRSVSVLTTYPSPAAGQPASSPAA